MVKSQNDELEDEADEAVEDEEDEKPEEAEPVAKSVKQRKVRKKKDKNAPPPPLSAYAFFFRETQAKVKSQNPGAKFGDVSRSVAAMWEALSENEKTAYRTMSVDDHARFDAAMKAYRATQPATPQTGNAAAPKAKSVKVVFLGGKMLTTTTPAATPAEQPNQSNPIFQVGSTMMPLTTSVTPVKPEDITDNECIRTGCKNFAIKSPEWEDEYCSNDCAIRHCKDVFATFVANNLKV
jgi:toll-like receptor 13